MAVVGTFNKQPSEILDCSINYAPVLPGGVTLSGTPTATVTPSGVTVSGLALTDTNTKLYYKVSGGTDGTPYKITTTVDTSNGLKYEDEVNVVVEEL
jgi:hypothetical protein